jgi:isoleucyl-tRNA synthetase
LGYSLYLEHQGKPYEISGEALDDGFLEALYAIYVAQQHPLCPMKCLEQGKEILFFQELLLQHLLLQRFLYSSLIISPSFLDKKGERYSYRSLALSAETLLFEEYGESSVKLSLLLKSSLSSDSVYFYDYVLRQLWNGVRYCSQQYSADFTMESAFQVFEKQADELDIWLIGELATLYLEFTNLLNYQAILRHFYYFQYFVQRKLLGWYVEIKKEMSG